MAKRSTKTETAPPPPVLHVTSYDQVSSGLMAAVIALVVIVSVLSFAWFASRTEKPPPAYPVELVEWPGGVEDGSPDETLRVDSPLPELTDPTPGDVVSDQNEIEQALDSVVALADDAAGQEFDLAPARQFGMGERNAGKPGSASGTGRRALGSGSGLRGFPREQRWYVRFSDRQSLDEYAQQLDAFGIEFGAIIGDKLIYVSKFATARPQTRTVIGGAAEDRLYMTWQGGARKQADLQLFRKAGVDVGSGAILHFYPKPIENQLAQIELAYHNRKAHEIRRTYFEVVPAGKGYEFKVIRQTYLK